jgi:phosphate starvation-inducible PhoH-like protein
MIDLLGHHDELLEVIENRFKTEILVRGNEITIKGESSEVDTVGLIFKELIDIVNQGRSLNIQSVGEAIEIITGEEELPPSKVLGESIVTHRGKAIYPKTAGQHKYVKAIEKNTLVFGIGPAGTGKTYLAMAMAVKSLIEKRVSRIILTRPVVEAGEKLGFLPGDIYQKVDPYLRPLYDALYDMMDSEQFQRLLDKGTIEVAPLAYMRGRTLNDSFIILDEAQNTSPEQIKMFLTRLGFGSKIVVTGDVTQIDLPVDKRSGLSNVEQILQDVDDVAFVYLSGRDVVRHSLVQRIVEAYKQHEKFSQAEGRSVSQI